MKNYDETINTVFNRINEYEIAQKRKRNIITRTAALLCCFCLVTLLGFGIWQSGVFNTTRPSIWDGSSSAGEITPYPNDTTESPGNDVVITPPDTSVIWADGNSEDNAMSEWNGKQVSVSLLDAFHNTSDEHIFAITASFLDIDIQFLYNGKTLAEYAAEADSERQFPDKLAQLLKEGHSLKYGEALYQSGTPEGEKWVKELYEERVAFYGEELLSKYIVDGVFLQEKVETDLVSAYSEDRAQKAYKLAYNAYMDQIFDEAQKKLSKQNINYDRVPGANYLIIYASEDELASLSLDNISGWFFGFANKNDSDEVLADDFTNDSNVK